VQHPAADLRFDHGSRFWRQCGCRSEPISARVGEPRFGGRVFCCPNPAVCRFFGPKVSFPALPCTRIVPSAPRPALKNAQRTLSGSLIRGSQRRDTYT
jgi:hypothetical protein